MTSIVFASAPKAYDKTMYPTMPATSDIRFNSLIECIRLIAIITSMSSALL